MKKRKKPKSYVQNTYGEAVRRHRESAGLSQTVVADHLGIHQSAVSRIESGLQHLTIEEAILLGELLGVPPCVIVFGHSHEKA